jgi:hypothetical protein
MKKPLLIVALALCLTSVIAQEPRPKPVPRITFGDPVPVPHGFDTTPSPSIPKWTPLGTDETGSTLWSTRNFSIVESKNTFTFELRTDFAPGTEDIVGIETVNHSEATILVSCKFKASKVIADKFYSKDHRVLSQGVLTLGARFLVAPEGSPNDSVMHFVCDHLNPANRRITSKLYDA